MLILNYLSIKKQLFILVCMVTVLMLVLQVSYYFQGSRIISTMAADYSGRNMEQIEDSATNMLLTVRGIALTISSNDLIQQYLKSTDNQARFDLYRKVQNVFSFFTNTISFVESIMILDLEGRSLNVTRGGISLAQNEINELIDGNKRIPSEIFSIHCVSRKYSSNDIWYWVLGMPIYNVSPEVPALTLVGYCLIVNNFTVLDSLTRSGQEGTRESLYLLDRNGTPLLPVVAPTFSTPSFSVAAYEKDPDLIVRRREIPKGAWTLVGISNKKDLYQELVELRNFEILIGIIILLLILIVSSFIIRSITVPVERIVHFARTIDQAGERKPLQIRRNSELNVVADAINEMLEKIDRTSRSQTEEERKFYNLEIEKRQADLAALQMQINPHFLYNTIECIRGIALYHEIPEIALITESMGELFRYMIKDHDLVPLERELSMIRKYLAIMNIRFRGKFTFVESVPENLLSVPIPKLILQPLIENSIYHGLEQVLRPGLISLVALHRDGQLFFTITDNGCGMPAQKLKELRAVLSAGGTGGEAFYIGLLNIHNRLRLLYGREYGLRIEETKGKGMTVVLAMPCLLPT